MRLLTEAARYFMTAFAVAVAIPTAFSLLSLMTDDRMSLEAFFGIGTISFVLAIFGGIIFGFPALWLARRENWHRDLRKLIVMGIIFGATGGMLLSFVFWHGNLEVIMPSLLPWASMGAIAGVVSACSWFWLHPEYHDVASDD